jgi:hypothetical protein
MNSRLSSTAAEGRSHVRAGWRARLAPKLGVALLAAASGGLSLLGAGDAAAQIPLPPPPPLPAVVVAPPSVVVTTARPVYYEGHAHYWYGNHWYWRDPHGWHTYEAEPRYLREHRFHAPPPRYHYEHRR